MMKKSGNIPIDIYRKSIFFIYSEWDDVIEELLDNFELSEDEIHEITDYPNKLGNFEGLTFTLNNGADIIWISSEIQDRSELTNIVAHEATHAMFRIMDNIGMKRDDNNEEAFAYLNGWIVQQIIQVLS